MNDALRSEANRCLDRMHSELTPRAFGYKIQALAAHVLVRLGYEVANVNESGHPDIAAYRNGKEFRFEVEAEVIGPRLRQLDNADFASLTAPRVFGYFALAIAFPAPYWVLVPASKLISRKHPSSNMLLEALSDEKYSREWTMAYREVLQNSCRLIRLASFNELSQMAKTGRGL